MRLEFDSDESRLTALQTSSQRGKRWWWGGERAPTYWINLEKDITGYLWKMLETQLKKKFKCQRKQASISPAFHL